MLISIASLAIGITCANLLITYVLYETNIEADNKNKDKILYMSQDFPFEEGKRVSYIGKNSLDAIKERYPEVEYSLQMTDMSISYARVDDETFENLSILTASNDFPVFFTYKVIEGDLNTVFTAPGKVAILENTAQRMFGKDNPIGKHITLEYESEGIHTYEVAAVLENHHRAFLKFDMLTLIPADFYGGVSMLICKEGADAGKLLEKINNDSSIPRLNMDSGKFYFSTLQEASLDSFPNEAIWYIHHGQKELISIGLISAILILLIACFNYANLLLSRILQQIRQINVERLMGAGFADIRFQLFTDAFLTVLISFLIALLLMHDFLSVFNSIMHSSLTTGFFLSSSVLWVLILFVLLLSFLPSIYISYRLSRLSEADYRNNYTGKKKNTMISLMVTFQFIISIGLLMATVTVNRQLGFTENRGERYKNMIETGQYNAKLVPEFKQEIARIPGVVSASFSDASVLFSTIRELSVTLDDGTKIPWAIELYDGDKDFLKTFSIRQLAGDDVEEIVTRYPESVLVNETFVKSLVPPGTDPIGKLWRDFDEWGDSLVRITGIVEDFQVVSSDTKIRPGVISLHERADTTYYHLHIKMDGVDNAATFKRIEQVWEQMQLGEKFIWVDVYQQYMERNRSVMNLSELLSLYAGISLILTFLGLIGITLYSVRQRRKELAIRKINGASDWQIVFMLIKPYLFQMLIAFIIGFPIVWWLLTGWLQQFVYRIDISFVSLLLSLLSIAVISSLTVVLTGWRVIRKNPVEVIRKND